MILDIKETLTHFIEDKKTVTEIFNAILRYGEELKSQSNVQVISALKSDILDLKAELIKTEAELTEFKSIHDEKFEIKRKENFQSVCDDFDAQTDILINKLLIDDDLPFDEKESLLHQLSHESRRWGIHLALEESNDRLILDAIDKILSQRN